MALLHDPDLIILDEPMSGLDPPGRDLIAKIFMELQHKGKTIFFSTHIIPDIEALCDSVGILVNGEIKYTGSVQDILYSGDDAMEMTLSLPDAADINDKAQLKMVQLKDDAHLIWRKGELFKLRVKQTTVSEYMQLVTSAGGSIIKLEQKKKNFETLFRELTSKEKN